MHDRFPSQWHRFYIIRATALSLSWRLQPIPLDHYSHCQGPQWQIFRSLPQHNEPKHSTAGPAGLLQKLIMSCLNYRPRARDTTTHIQVNFFVLAYFFTFQQFYSIYPASEYSTFCLASRWQPVVHSGFSAAGQLVTLVYRGKINDLPLWCFPHTPPLKTYTIAIYCPVMYNKDILSMNISNRWRHSRYNKRTRS